MIIGVTATSLAFVSLIVSVTAYYIYYKREEQNLLKIARIGFYTASVLIFFQAALLMWGILTHKFEWLYVFSYSSKDLELYYLISTFWAGQEGTFLLWLALGSIYGLFIIRGRKQDEPLVMTFMNLIQAYILMILIKKNPFAFVWEVNPNGFIPGQVPMDGNGLNPLLQDPWMTIHPPVLFAGYSSTMILFAYAMSALIRRNYNDWIKSVYPYALFVAVSLGTGIILGGYWAYTTLGWGGYWAWDPVENSSLIPWLTSIALIHGMVIQRKQGGMKKTNIFLALTTFVLVLYGSFLTRSGVLTDFSVHSFGSSELNQYLIGFVLLFLAIGLITFLFRTKEVKSEKVQTAFFTRESFMLFGMLVILILAVLTFVGTSSPIFTGIMGEASNVSIEYYNTLAGPIAVLMGLLIALAPVLRWKTTSEEKIKTITLHGIISAVAGVIIFFLGIKDILPLIIAALSIFVILVNGHLVWKMASKKNFAFGGYLTHVGIGLMLIGVITSSVYDSSQKVTLPKDTKKEVLGFDLEYGGKFPSPDGKDKVLIKINDKESFAKFYWSEYSRAYMVAPSVKNMPLQDVYISPIQIIPADEVMNQGSDQLTLTKGQTVDLDKYKLTFTGYDMGSHGNPEGEIQITAVVDVANQEGTNLGTVRPAIKMTGNAKQVQPVKLLDSGREVFINGINVESGSIALGVSKPLAGSVDLANKELLAVEVSIKPLINVLWLGTIIMVMGFFVTGYYHTRKKFA